MIIGGICLILLGVAAVLVLHVVNVLFAASLGAIVFVGVWGVAVAVQS